MVYKKYRYYKGKKLGPYYYKSVRQSDGTVKSVYLGTKNPNKAKYLKKPTFTLPKLDFIKNVPPRTFIIIILAFVMLGGFFVLQGLSEPGQSLVTGFATLPEGPGGCSYLSNLNETNISSNITVCAGTYYMNDTNGDGGFVENNGTLVINASFLELDCNGAIIIGDNLGYGIVIENQTNVTVRNCILQNYGTNLYVYNMNASHIVDNTIKDSFGASGSSYFVSVTNNNISNNSVSDNAGHGINMDPAAEVGPKDSSDNIFYNNSVYSSTGGTGIMMTGNWNSTIYNNLIYLNGLNGISVSNNNISIYNNTIYGNSQIGIRATASNISIFQNNISDNTDSGIEITNKNNTVYNNTISGNDEGVNINAVAANNNSVYNNTIYLNSAESVYIQGASGCTIDNNTLQNGTYGVRISGVGTENKVRSNNITGNTDTGILLSAMNNLLFNNYIAENTLNNVQDTVAPNNWTSENQTRTSIIGGGIVAGNYYGDYTGSDTDADYIGDTQWTLPGGGGNVDTYPLSYPTPDVNISLIYPSANRNVTYYQWFNVTVNVSCITADCGNIDVTLDPIGDTSNPDTDEWTMFGGSLNHTSYTTSRSPENMSHIVKTYTTNGDIKSSPAVAYGYVYVGSNDDKLYQLNATDMSLVNSYDTGDDVYSSPAIAGGYVFFGSDNGIVYKLNATDLSLNSSYNTGDDVTSSPAVVNESVYVGSHNKKVYRLNATDMSLIASYTTGNWIWKSSPAVVDGYVYIGSDDNKVYKLNATDMLLNSSYNTGDDVRSSPTVAGEYVYVGSMSDKLYQLNLTDMSLVNSYDTGSWVMSSPAVADGYVYVGSMSDFVYKLNATDLTLNSSYDTGWNVDSSPAIANGYVYVGTQVGHILQLNATDMSLVIDYDITGDWVDSSPAIANGYMYIGTDDNSIYQLSSDKRTVSTKAGEIPFWTNKSSNPVTISLNAGQSQLVTFWVNSTGSYYSDHEFYAYVNRSIDTSVNAETDHINVTITTPAELALTEPWNGASLQKATSQSFQCSITNTESETNLTLYIWDTDGSILYSNTKQLTGPTVSTSWDYTLPDTVLTGYNWNCKGYVGSAYTTDYVWANSGNFTFNTQEEEDGTTASGTVSPPSGSYSFGTGTTADTTTVDIDTSSMTATELFSFLEETYDYVIEDALGYAVPSTTSTTYWFRQHSSVELVIDAYEYWIDPTTAILPDEIDIEGTITTGEEGEFAIETDVESEIDTGGELKKVRKEKHRIKVVKIEEFLKDIKVEVNGITQIRKQQTSRVTLGINSDYWEMIIEEGNTENADLNKDGVKDVAITYDGMKEEMVKMTFKKLLHVDKETQEPEDEKEEEEVKPLFDAYSDSEFNQMLKAGEVEKKPKKKWIDPTKFKIVISLLVLSFIAIVQVVIFMKRRANKQQLG